MTILKAENISKQYRLGNVGTGTLSHDLNRFWHTIRGKEDPYLKVGAVNDRSSKAKQQYVWALRDINFEVQEGEVLGIIGKNGAGKSTLLKILSRVTSPTTGVIKTKGRIASLLEVGTGFHPELTGRENIYLNGAILGMTRSEITAKLDEIIEFSGCEMYIDTPVKRYSSGMTVRLAFAVAAHLEPDILVVDEVLAVGDAEFQKKAIGKMQDISKGEGRTVLFVSHDMNSISLLTERVIVLKNGKVTFNGETRQGIMQYLQDEHSSKEFNYSGELTKPKILQVKLETSLPNNTQEFSKSLSVFFEVYLPFSTNNLALSFQIMDELGSPVTHLWHLDAEANNYRDSGTYSFLCAMPKLRLYIGHYSIRVHLSNSKTKEKFHFLDSVCNFKVEMIKNYRPDYKWEKGTARYIEDSKWVIENYEPETENKR